MFSYARRVRTGVDRLFRGVALLFLLLTCVDIGSPDVCAEEIFGFPPEVLSLAASASERAAEPAMGSRELPSHETSEPSHVEEDCFCCCSHLVASPHFAVLGAEPDSVTTRPLSLRLPQSAPSNLYHPPRVA
jgi:hypothetical protein